MSNALLIAAAPDMLAALELVRDVDEGPSGADGMERSARAEDAVRTCHRQGQRRRRMTRRHQEYAATACFSRNTLIDTGNGRADTVEISP